MSAAELVRSMVRDGYRVSLTADRQRLHVEPVLANEELRGRVISRRDDLLAYLREIEGVSAAAHAFVAAKDADSTFVTAFGVCISCGIPWALHGEPPVPTWASVNDPNEAVLLQAAAIVAAVAGAQ